MLNKLQFSEQFLSDVAEHKVTVLENTDNIKVIHCGKPNTINQSFTVIYTANRAVITGDMGSYTFGHLLNPYEFFAENDSALSFAYLTEKCLAEDRNYPIQEFDEELAEKVIRETIYQYASKLDQQERDELLDEFESSIKYLNFSNQFKVEQWYVRIDYDPMSDALLEVDFDDFNIISYHFKWCVQAISWATREFNKVVNKK